MNTASKTFAFKLSKKQSKPYQSKKWTAREGLSVAGCTDPTHTGDYRWNSPSGGFDNSDYC